MEDVGSWNQRNDVKSDENDMTECARGAVMLDGEISRYVDILQGVAQGCTLSPIQGKGKPQVGTMDAILTDPHIDTRIEM